MYNLEKILYFANEKGSFHLKDSERKRNTSAWRIVNRCLKAGWLIACSKEHYQITHTGNFASLKQYSTQNTLRQYSYIKT